MNWLHQTVANILPLVPRPIVGRVSSRYIAGESLVDAANTIRTLNEDGFRATLDVLGEFVQTESEAKRSAQEYLDVLDVLERESLDGNVSLKLTQMGLKLDADLCLENTRSVVRQAVTHGNFVRLDMEDHTCTSETLEIHRRLRDEYPGSVGCVIQSYLKRSRDDVRVLAEQKANVRLCKGIYVEPEEIAFKDPERINRSFEELLRELLVAGSYVGIATHDLSLVRFAMDLIAEMDLGPEAYEFQMLLGVRPVLRRRILDGGHPLRVYVPFGSHWYAYSLRRLKENPDIAGHILRNLFNGG